MKKIGETQDGGALVEMSRQEYKMFLKLVAVERGGTLRGGWEMYQSDPMWNNAYDLTTVFGAIQAYMEGRVVMNELQSYTERLEASLNQPDRSKDAE